MVLHVAGEGPVLMVDGLHELIEVVVGSLELCKDLDDILADDVREHVQTSSVRHSDDHLCDAVIHNSSLHRRVNASNGSLASIDSESFCGLVLVVEELLEGVDVAKIAVDGEQLLLLGGDELWVLHALPKPFNLGIVSDVHVLQAQGLGVDPRQLRQDLPQRRLPADGAETDLEAALHVGLGEAVEGRLELWRVILEPATPLVEAQGIQICRHVALLLVGPDEVLEPSGHAATWNNRAAAGRSCRCQSAQVCLLRSRAKCAAGCRRGWRFAGLQSLEVRGPLGAEGRGVGLPLPIETLEVHGITPGGHVAVETTT
mmetsp:Transcript_32102/g.70249  ORF Transcript_32102/g.70249 Transcript_32102/m.70249 type:complete len:315 (-) Transcript_32102:112-1056(-)